VSAVHWIKDKYPEYIKNSKNETPKRRNNPINKLANELNSFQKKCG
jgi:hypothetical protein